MLMLAEKKEPEVTVAAISAPSTPQRSPTIVEQPSSDSISAEYAKDYTPSSTNPCSAFYTHPSTRTSLEQLRTPSKSFDADLESGLGASPRTSMGSASKPVELTKTYTTVWPEKENIEQETMERKMMRRTCAPLKHFTPKQCILIKVLIGLLVVGVAIGVGVGISKAVGGTFYKSSSQQGSIG